MYNSKAYVHALNCLSIFWNYKIVRRCFEDENDLSAEEKAEKKRTRLQKKNENEKR